MDLRFYEPPAGLQPYVKVYLFYRMENAFLSDALKFIPSGNPYIVFNLEDPFTIENDKHKKGLIQDGVFAVGQQESYYLLKPDRHFSNFCIIFQPTGLSRLFHLPIHEMTNDSIHFDLITNHHLNRIMDQLREKKSNPEQTVRDLNAFFSKQLLHHQPAYPYVEYTIEVIKQRKGLVGVAELAELSNTCERNYRRRFIENTGISPKKYISITRLWNIFYTVNHYDPFKINWSDVTFNLGYYDQMHLIKEFKKLCGEPPSVYFSKYTKKQSAAERDLLFI